MRFPGGAPRPAARAGVAGPSRALLENGSESDDDDGCDCDATAASAARGSDGSSGSGSSDDDGCDGTGPGVGSSPHQLRRYAGAAAPARGILKRRGPASGAGNGAADSAGAAEGSAEEQPAALTKSIVFSQFWEHLSLIGKEGVQLSPLIARPAVPLLALRPVDGSAIDR